MSAAIAGRVRQQGVADAEPAADPRNMQRPCGVLGFFVAAVLGAVLARERRAQLPAAALVLGLSIAWDMLFFAFDTLPATVPVALALLISEARRISLVSPRPGHSRA